MTMSCLQCIRHYTTNYDIFSRKVMFTYNGRSSFKTFIGGIITMAILIFTVIYSVALFRDLYLRKKVSASTNSLKNAWKADDLPLDMSKTGVRIYAIWKNVNNIPVSSKHGQVIAKYYKNSEFGKHSENSEIVVSKCTDTTFPNIRNVPNNKAEDFW